MVVRPFGVSFLQFMFDYFLFFPCVLRVGVISFAICMLVCLCALIVCRRWWCGGVAGVVVVFVGGVARVWFCSG